ncbi:hypothetical protein Tco_1114953 [Tanacetum coccineum]
MGNNNGQREIRPVWNSAHRINHQNKFVPFAVLTRIGRVPVTPNTKILNDKVNTVRVNGVNTVGQIAVSDVKGNGVTAIKASAGCVWRPKMTDLNNVSKDNSGPWVSKRVNYIDSQGRLETDIQEKDKKKAKNDKAKYENEKSVKRRKSQSKVNLQLQGLKLPSL